MHAIFLVVIYLSTTLNMPWNNFQGMLISVIMFSIVHGVVCNGHPVLYPRRLS